MHLSDNRPPELLWFNNVTSEINVLAFTSKETVGVIESVITSLKLLSFSRHVHLFQ